MIILMNMLSICQPIPYSEEIYHQGPSEKSDACSPDDNLSTAF